METLLPLIDHKLTMNHLQQHLPHVLLKLKAALAYVEYKNTSKHTPPLKYCKECGNCKQNNFVKTEETAFVCIGRDGQGCGFVLGWDNLTEPYVEVETEDSMGFYSDGYLLKSYLKTSDRQLLKTNELVERMQQKIQSDSLTTSNVYKDKMRQKTYAQVDEFLHRGLIQQCVYRKFKSLFHCYRTHFTRIHKITKVIACLLYIAMNPELLD